MDSLLRIDRYQSRSANYYSLSPLRSQPPPLDEVIGRLFEKYQSSFGNSKNLLKESISTHLAQIIELQLEHFPQTIFWDWEGVASWLLSLADRADAADGELKQFLAQFEAIYRMFGTKSDIGFCYSHDFIYGFDWVKWVKRGESWRHRSHPYSARFLDALIDRGAELMDLIENDDARYSLKVGEKGRNPFSFSRGIKEEKILHQQLSVIDMIPLEAWKYSPQAHFLTGFQEKRKELADALNLGASDCSDPII